MHERIVTQTRTSMDTNAPAAGSYPLPLRERVPSERLRARRVRGRLGENLDEENPSPGAPSSLRSDGSHPLPQGERVTEFAARTLRLLDSANRGLRHALSKL